MNSGQFAVANSNPVASWSWLAELIRATCCQLYALGGDNDTVRLPQHSNGILSEVQRRVGDVNAFSPTRDDLRLIFRLLCRLEDFAHVRRGTYIPRETRIMLFSPKYARIAGGLPIQFSEYSDEGVVLCEAATIGRIVEVACEDKTAPLEWSRSRCFDWGAMSLSQRVSMLCAKAQKQTMNLKENISFYNPKKPQAYWRGSRWQNSPIRAKYCVARLSGLKKDYFLVSDSGGSAERWFEICYGDARCWLVVIDQMANVVHTVKRQIEGGIIRLTLPMNMPDFCLEAMASASSHFQKEDFLMHFCIPESLSPLVDYICTTTALHQYE